ncbi:MAG: type III-A CRISPR-associated RAMP protein Csm4 [Bacteroidales bacterium]|nr:type III-A CRISPR-associated RAMP protein Csm4 [Lachnoclostridium sp.]MCM1383153.1 type III-A CRISPR-associated RAMP protein Csm4 [Lachnoclostridium sp.]MCM1464621.1 type III-A CRISPR-associated RAMP protein Csm4 [Bacteroidales bacterium]
MKYKLYKLTFQSAVHFGKHNLGEGEYICCADTLFSALCQEAVKISENVLQDFYRYAKEGSLLLSDMFPYMGDTYYVPKPMKCIEPSDGNGDSATKKAYKKLKYIPMDMLDIYLQGQYDVLNAPNLEKLGHFEMKTAVSIRGEEKTEPYRIGTYYYGKGNGLYLIAGYEKEEALELVEELLENLSLSGIGGKRASGLGRFMLFQGEVPESFCKRLDAKGARYMSLSVSLPTDEELETLLKDAEYLLCKRSGFVASEQYAPEQMRKRDLYVFKSGSCFAEKFNGDIYDVSGEGGGHPVYRYAKPMLVEV